MESVSAGKALMLRRSNPRIERRMNLKLKLGAMLMGVVDEYESWMFGGLGEAECFDRSFGLLGVVMVVVKFRMVVLLWMSWLVGSRGGLNAVSMG